MNINLNDLIYVALGVLSAYFTFRLNSKKDDRDYIVEQNKRLNAENKRLIKRVDDLEKELNNYETKH